MKTASSSKRPPLSRVAKIRLAGAATALTALALIAVAELELRRRHQDISHITGVLPWRTAEWEGLTYHWDVFHPIYGWSNLPGYRSDERVPFKVTINQQGLRAKRDYSPHPTPEVRRIAVFGDSCVFGEEVDDDQTLPAHLERSLGNVEALNFGVRGFGLGQMILRLEEEVPQFDPQRVLLVILIPSDITRDFTDFFTHAKPAFRFADGRLNIDNLPVRQFDQQPWLLRHSYAAAWMWGRPRRWPDQLELDEAMMTPGALLSRAATFCQSRDIRLTLATIVTPGTIELMETDPSEAARNRLMVDALRQSGIDLIDLTGILQTAFHEQGESLAAPIAHWSGAGNRVIAGALAERLSKQERNAGSVH